MRILFVQGVSRGLTASLAGHEVIEARKLKWEGISNGALLKVAKDAGFGLLVTTDKNLRYQQNLSSRRISIVVLGQSPWWLVKQYLETISAAANAAVPGSFSEIEMPLPPKKPFTNPRVPSESSASRCDMNVLWPIAGPSSKPSPDSVTSPTPDSFKTSACALHQRRRHLHRTRRRSS